MQVCKTALHFQECSQQILVGIGTETGLPSLRKRYPLLGKTSGGRQAAPEVSGDPVLLLSSPWTHSAKRAETEEGKHPLYLQAAPKNFAEPFDPEDCVLFCCRAAIASVGSPSGGFCSFSSLKSLLHFAFSSLDAALSRALHLCLLLVPPPGASFLCPLPFGVCKAGGLNVSSPVRSPPVLKISLLLFFPLH